MPRWCGLSLLVLVACGAPEPFSIRIDSAGLVAGAWQDGDGLWQPTAGGTKQVTQGRYGVALVCESDPRVWVYFSRQPHDEYAPSSWPDYGCGTAQVPATTWFDEPVEVDPTCNVPSPPPSCPALIRAAVTYDGQGDDPVTILSHSAAQVYFESPTEARLPDPGVVEGAKYVTVIATGSEETRAQRQQSPPGLPFAFSPFELPGRVDLAVHRDQITWGRGFANVYAELRGASVTVRETMTSGWVAEASERMPIFDPAVLHATVGRFAPGEAVAWKVDLIDSHFRDPITNRVGAQGSLTW